MKKLLLIAAVSMSATFAQAGEAEVAVFNQLDVDTNGLVSESEAQVLPELMPLFANLDTDHDGQLSLAEYELITAK